MAPISSSTKPQRNCRGNCVDNTLLGYQIQASGYSDQLVDGVKNHLSGCNLLPFQGQIYKITAVIKSSRKYEIKNQVTIISKQTLKDIASEAHVLADCRLKH